MNAGYSRRTALIIGEDGVEKLRRARVAVFGLGGVGGSAAEALARAGVGTLELFDMDTVAESNLNRQIFATKSAVGARKTDAAAARLAEAAPNTEVIRRDMFFGADSASEVDFASYDAVIDAIDTVSSKLLIIELCAALGTPVYSSMGTGNKLDPTRLRVSDIYETSVCPLARVMRRECRRRGIESLRVVWSDEEPIAPSESGEALPEGRRQIPGSTPFVPPVAGIILASEAVRGILGK